MRRQHHRHALLVELADIGPELLAQFDVDACGRFVEHQHGRRVDHRFGDHQAALHPARQRAGIGVGLVLEMHRAQQFHRTALRLGDTVQPRLDLERLDRREERVEQDLLVDDADRRLGVTRMLVGVEAPDRGGAAGLVDQARQDVDQRRLACAIGAEQPEDLAARHIERHIVERALAALVGLAQVRDGDGGLSHALRIACERGPVIPLPLAGGVRGGTDLEPLRGVRGKALPQAGGEQERCAPHKPPPGRRGVEAQHRPCYTHAHDRTARNPARNACPQHL